MGICCQVWRPGSVLWSSKDGLWVVLDGQLVNQGERGGGILPPGERTGDSVKKKVRKKSKKNGLSVIKSQGKSLFFVTFSPWLSWLKESHFFSTFPLTSFFQRGWDAKSWHMDEPDGLETGATKEAAQSISDVTFGLSKVAATKTFGTLLMQLVFEVLGESTWFRVIQVIQGDMGMGDIPGVQGGSGESVGSLGKLAQLTHKNSDLGSECANGTCYILLQVIVKSPVVLVTKSMGIVTPLVLRLVVVVAPRLISYKTSPARLYRTQVMAKIISYRDIHIVTNTWLRWREGRERNKAVRRICIGKEVRYHQEHNKWSTGE